MKTITANIEVETRIPLPVFGVFAVRSKECPISQKACCAGVAGYKDGEVIVSNDAIVSEYPDIPKCKHFLGFESMQKVEGPGINLQAKISCNA